MSSTHIFETTFDKMGPDAVKRNFDYDVAKLLPLPKTNVDKVKKRKASFVLFCWRIPSELKDKQCDSLSRSYGLLVNYIFAQIEVLNVIIQRMILPLFKNMWIWLIGVNAGWSCYTKIIRKSGIYETCAAEVKYKSVWFTLFLTYLKISNIVMSKPWLETW